MKASGKAAESKWDCSGKAVKASGWAAESEWDCSGKAVKAIGRAEPPRCQPSKDDRLAGREVRLELCRLIPILPAGPRYRQPIRIFRSNLPFRLRVLVFSKGPWDLFKSTAKGEEGGRGGAGEEAAREGRRWTERRSGAGEAQMRGAGQSRGDDGLNLPQPPFRVDGFELGFGCRA